MGKRKKKNRKNKYNKQQFVEIICTKCRLCEPTTTRNSAAFCYEMYKKQPKVFMKKIYPPLCTLEEWNSDNKMKTLQTFVVLFCINCSAYNIASSKNCPRLNLCLNSFEKQIDPAITFGNDLRLTSFSKKELKRMRKRQPERKRRTIYEPYPTAFYNKNNEDWEDFIHKVLNEDNISEQVSAGADTS